jgi:hypothetical protein
MLLIDDDAAVLRYAMLNRIKSAALAAGFPEPEYLKQDHSAALAALAEVGVLSAIRNRGFTFEQLLPFVSDPELLCQAYEAVCEVPLFEEPGEPTEEDEAGDQQEAMGGVMVVAETTTTGQMDSDTILRRPMPRRRPKGYVLACQRLSQESHSQSAGAKAAPAASDLTTQETQEESEAYYEFVGQSGLLRLTLVGRISKTERVLVWITQRKVASNIPVFEGRFATRSEENAVIVDIPDIPRDKDDLVIEVSPCE